MSLLRIVSILSLAVFFVSCNTNDEVAIRKQAQTYEAAFNRGDAKALADLWAEDAEYVNPESGEVISGREAIRKEFQVSLQERKNAHIEIKIGSITFPNSHQAVETGTAIVTRNGDVLSQTVYKATYEKQNGDWLITQVREVESMDVPTQYAHLKQLEWLVGEWVDKDQDVVIKINIHWDKFKNFLTQKFSVTVEGKLELEGRQLIAWDPVNEQIRSWMFDSDGGFGEGKWKKKGNSWVVETSQTLADGKRASAINIYTPIDHNSYKWESVGREVGGDILPNIAPVTVIRVKE